MHQVALLTESCSKTKKLPEIWKVAEKLPSNLWKGLPCGPWFVALPRLVIGKTSRMVASRGSQRFGVRPVSHRSRINKNGRRRTEQAREMQSAPRLRGDSLRMGDWGRGGGMGRREKESLSPNLLISLSDPQIHHVTCSKPPWGFLMISLLPPQSASFS